MVAFCSTVQIFHWLFCPGSLDVDIVSRFQNRICIIESQEKEHEILNILMKKWDQLQLTLSNSISEDGWGNHLDNKKICSRQREFEFLNAIFYRFYSEGTIEIGFVWSSIFWVFKLSRVDCIYEFPIFSPQI